MQRATLERTLGGSYTGVQFRAGIGRVGVLATLELGACPVVMHRHPIIIIIVYHCHPHRHCHIAILIIVIHQHHDHLL